MPRVEFDGKGTPLPSQALPPFGGASDLPATVLTFAEDVNFPVSDYIALGFTHFEIWCVGAAGGRGGDATSEARFAIEEARRPVSQDVWNLQRERLRIEDYYTAGLQWDHIYHYGPNPAMPNNGDMTIVQAEEYFNPTHLMTFRTYKQVVLSPSIEGMGGGGGGGGFHRAAGTLASLPASVPIVVGKAGVDAGYGQIHQNGAWAPDVDPPPYPNPAASPYPENRLRELHNYFHTYLNVYPLPHEAFPNPQPGGDGGASSFAGAICRASGGEGGDPGMRWDGVKFVIDGDGGDGGIGGRILLGGGAAGSTAEGVNGSDGIWVPETGIGAGGGGGKGGRPSTNTNGPPPLFTPIVTQHLATAGGQGSYSFGDTSVYGQRQFRQPWTYMKPTTVLGSGIFTFVPTVDQDRLVTPGGGGGARPLSNLKYGGRAAGYSPDGVVVLRLTKIT